MSANQDIFDQFAQGINPYEDKDSLELGETPKYQETPQGRDYGYGLREDKTHKGLGYFGPIKMKNKSDSIFGEISMSGELDDTGKEHLFPSVIPGLTQEELKFLGKGTWEKDGKFLPSIKEKAYEFARQRLEEGKPFFAMPEEEGKTPIPQTQSDGGDIFDQFAQGINPYDQLTKEQINRKKEKEAEEWEGSTVKEAAISGARSLTTMLPTIGKAYSSFTKPKEGKDLSVVQKAVKATGIVTGMDPFLSGSSNLYDIAPEYFGKSHAQVMAEKGKPIPENIQKSLTWKATEFATMDLPFLISDIASLGTTKVARFGVLEAAKIGARRLAQKEAYVRGANIAFGITAKPVIAATASKGLTKLGVPEPISDLIGLPIGYNLIPSIVDNSGKYILQKATESLLKKARNVSDVGIIPTFATASQGTATDIALGIMQKNVATKNIMKDFIAGQDKQFGDSLLNIVAADKAIIDESENFLTTELETKKQDLSVAEGQVAKEQAALGEQTKSLEIQQKALQTQYEDQSEATKQILEESETPQKPSIQPQIAKITKESTQSLPSTEISVGETTLRNASNEIKANASTPQDHQAATIIDRIPLPAKAPQTAIETIYDSISPRIGRPEAGQIYKDQRNEAYKKATIEKKKIYGDLLKAAKKTKYKVPEVPFRQMMFDLNNMISGIEKLEFLSPTQERAVNKLKSLRDAFNEPGSFVQNWEELSGKQNVPTLLKMWETRKTLGQVINWKSSLPGEKILKNEYHKFDSQLKRMLKQAGLLEQFESANETFINRFLPLEQGTNGRVRFMSPQEAGRAINLDSIQALENFIPLKDLNPIRRHAIEKIVGHPEPGKIPYSKIQRIADVNRYLTPNEQAQFSALQNMPMIQAKVATNQLGKIERFLENNRYDLSPIVTKQLEKVTGELRSQADLPIEYITGTAQKDSLQKATDAQNKNDIIQLKKDKISLQRDLRANKRKTKEDIELLKEQQTGLSEVSKELISKLKGIKSDQNKLNKSLLSTILSEDTNRALLSEMSDVSGIRNVKNLFGDSKNGVRIFNGLKQLKAEQIFQNALSINAINKLMRTENTKNLLRELLTSEQFAKTEKLADLAKNIKEKFTYFVNQSNTQVQREHMNEFSNLMNGLFSILNPKKASVAGGKVLFKILVKTAAKRKLAQLMTNPEALDKTLNLMIKMKRNAGSKETNKAADQLIRYFLKTGFISGKAAEETNQQ